MKTIALLGFLVLLIIFLSWKTSREHLKGVPIVVADDTQNIANNTPTPHSDAVLSRFKEVYGRDPVIITTKDTPQLNKFAETLDKNKIDTSKPATIFDRKARMFYYNVDTRNADPSASDDLSLFAVLAISGLVYSELSTKVDRVAFKELSLAKIKRLELPEAIMQLYVKRLDETYDYYFKETSASNPAPMPASAPAAEPAPASTGVSTAWISDTASPLGALFKV
jgi:hypothetical protein